MMSTTEAAVHRCSLRKGVLRNFAKFTGKYLCQGLFFNTSLLKNRLWHGYFPVNFANFPKSNFSKGTSLVAASATKRNFSVIF